MYALIFSGLIIANGSAVLFGTDTMSPGFIMGGFVAVIGIVFGFLTVRCPHCGKLGHRILFTLRRIRSA